MNEIKALERMDIIAALRSISTGHALNNDLCMEIGWRMVCGLAAGLLKRGAEPNDPLTLEELRGMSNTDWVWVVFPELLPEENCWYRAKKLYDLYFHAHYGETWLAYRRKPDGGGEH